MADISETIIIDYGMGNLRSVEKALESVGGRPRISGDTNAVRKAERLILPGVGAFGDAMENLRRTGMDGAIREAVNAGVPLLGLCLGLQLLFTHSEEFGSHKGLDLIPEEFGDSMMPICVCLISDGIRLRIFGRIPCSKISRMEAIFILCIPCMSNRTVRTIS